MKVGPVSGNETRLETPLGGNTVKTTQNTTACVPICY